MTPDRVFYPLAMLAALALIALAMVYPQADGARSWGRFGHTPTQQTAAAIAQARHNLQVQQQTQRAAAALKAQQQREADSALVRTQPLK